VYGNVPKLKRIDCCMPPLLAVIGIVGRKGIDGRVAALKSYGNQLFSISNTRTISIDATHHARKNTHRTLKWHANITRKQRWIRIGSYLYGTHNTGGRYSCRLE
jgi:hypothetical protein